MKRFSYLLIVLSFMILLSFGCGGSESSPSASPTVGVPEPTIAAAVTTDSDGTSELSDVEVGQQLALTKGCVGCHSTDGSALVGPSWLGIYGSTEDLEDGSSVTVNDEYITESIMNPTAKIVKGFLPTMPSLAITDEEISSLIAYIKSLQ